ncbi:hypothetical protein ACFL33_02010, partial [Pseudomonadota bacterium]
MSTEKFTILESSSHPLSPPNLFQNVIGTSVPAKSIDSGPITCTRTLNGELWLNEDDFILRDSDGSVVRKLPQTEPQILDSQGSSRHVPGCSLVLSAPGDYHYYHWMVDVLPKIGFLKRA